MSDMSPEDSIYVKTLKWASDRGTYGFTMEELKSAVSKDESEWRYINQMFMGRVPGDTPLIFHDDGGTGDYRYFLTASGAGAAVNYFELKEAQKGGKWAMRFAILSIVVSTVIGLLGIYFDTKNQSTKGAQQETLQTAEAAPPQDFKG